MVVLVSNIATTVATAEDMRVGIVRYSATVGQDTARSAA